MKRIIRISMAAILTASMLLAGCNSSPADTTSAETTEETSPVKTTEESTESSELKVKLKSTNPVRVVVGKDFNIQDEVFKSIESSEGIKSITFEVLEDEKKEEETTTSSSDESAESTEEAATTKETQVLSSESKSGTENSSGVPSVNLNLSERGQYEVLATITDNDGQTVECTIIVEAVGELEYHTEGISLGDIKVEQGSTDLDFLKDVTYDEDYIRDVEVDDSNVNYDETGEYPLYYHITSVDKEEEEETTNSAEETSTNENTEEVVETATTTEEVTTTAPEETTTTVAPTSEETTTVTKETTTSEESSSEEESTKEEKIVEETIEVTVQVITPEEAVQEADEGNKVITTGNETVKDSEGNTVVEETKSSNVSETTASNNNSSNNGSTSSTTKTPTSGTTSSGNTNNNTSSTTSAKTPTTTAPTTTAPTTTAAAHVHTWVDVTTTVNHEAVTTQVWVVDTAAWDEPVYTEQPVYEYKIVCNGCGTIFNNEEEWGTHAALKALEGDTSHSYTVKSVQVGTQQVQTGTVHHDEVGHYETRVVTEAWTETVVTGQRCTGCGATK